MVCVGGGGLRSLADGATTSTGVHRTLSPFSSHQTPIINTHIHACFIQLDHF